MFRHLLIFKSGKPANPFLLYFDGYCNLNKLEKVIIKLISEIYSFVDDYIDGLVSLAPLDYFKKSII